MTKRALDDLTMVFVVALATIGLATVAYGIRLALDRTVVAQALDRTKPRLSGNCGPAAQGLTPDADVVPIKTDRAGRVILSPFQLGEERGR